MKSNSSSCLGTLFLLVITLAVIRYALPAVWKIIAGLFAGAFYFTLILLVLAVVVVGYFTYKNFTQNKKKEEVSRYARVTKVEDLYLSIVERLNQQVTLNEVSAEELLQSEILIKENLSTIRNDLIRLKDFASSRNQKQVSIQLSEYQRQMRDAKDPAARDVIAQNIKMVEEKKQRIDTALDEIRQNDALVELIYNSLTIVDEDIRFGRPVRRLFPDLIYQRFGLTPPADQQKLPPLLERSNE
jgi:hypothetical protein